MYTFKLLFVLYTPSPPHHRDGQTAGSHQLIITMDGQHVQNSPHGLDVKSKLDFTSYSVQNLIYYTKHPYCVAIDRDQNIYVASSGDCIDVFDSKGSKKCTIGHNGYGDGLFNMPCGIFIKDNDMYVADCENDRIQKLTLNGKFILKFNAQKPSAVIVDNCRRIIVAESKMNNVCIFNHNCDLLFTIRGDVAGINHFVCPRGLALDPRGNIHVAACDSNTIKVFSKEGVYIRTYGYPNKPSGIAIGGDGYSFVSESDGSCVSIFDLKGNKIHTVDNLNQPSGIAVFFKGIGIESDSRSSLFGVTFTMYIADSKADTICTYEKR